MSEHEPMVFSSRGRFECTGALRIADINYLHGGLSEVITGGAGVGPHSRLQLLLAARAGTWEVLELGAAGHGERMLVLAHPDALAAGEPLTSTTIAGVVRVDVGPLVICDDAAEWLAGSLDPGALARASEDRGVPLDVRPQGLAIGLEVPARLTIHVDDLACVTSILIPLC